ncbi:CAP domain-containing protein, partial [Arthrobacter bambusae]|uniref:CAP domain-containing protein n=1 Tax=Arthrobacter bambusae TaxID=1338426 RepID=UPI00278B65E9
MEIEYADRFRTKGQKVKSNYITKASGILMATLAITAGLEVPAQAATPISSNAINTYSRAAVAAAYANQWLPTTHSPINWTGDAASCQAGTESADSLVKGAQAINFYRGLAGLDSISFTDYQNTLAQQTALLMEANGQLSHYPDASWKCYTAQGAQGAATSNLHGGAGNYVIGSASTPVEGYMDDPGEGNWAVGHRRWILNPDTVTMGMGTTKGFNAINVFGAAADTTRTSPTMFGFPGSGYFPQQLEPNGRWSLSSGQNVDFSDATVNVKDANGVALGVALLSTAVGYGPNSISFEVQGVKYASGTGEADYQVTVDNMKKDNLPYSYTYTVRLFDGTDSTSDVVPADPKPTFPTLVAPVTPGFGATTYTIPTSTGIVYKVNGVVTQAGTYNASIPIAITAEAASSAYTVVGQTSWSKDFTPPPVAQPITVTPIAPTFTATTYTIPNQDGVRYKVNGGLSLPGTFDAAAPITITAVAEPGYILSGTTTWSQDLSPVLTQPIQVTPPAPTFGAGSYTIPSVIGVDYLVDNSIKPAGTYDAITNVTVIARAKAGYVLVGNASWSKNFTPVQVSTAAVTFTDKDGTAQDSYTIPVSAGVDYSVGGTVVPAGTYPGTGTVTVTAKAQTGYVLAPNTATQWTVTFTTGTAAFAPPAVSPFSDVTTNQPFYKEMAWMSEKGISTGWTEPGGARSYRPLTSINRDAMAAFLYRMAGSPAYTPPAVSPFTDVTTNQPFYKEMAWMSEKGISTGWTEPGGAR